MYNTNWNLCLIPHPLFYRNETADQKLLFSCCCVRVFVTLWTVACQGPLSITFPRQEQWSGLPFPSPKDLPNPGIEPRSPAWQVGSSPLNHQGSPKPSFSSVQLNGSVMSDSWQPHESQASRSITNSRSSLRLMSIELVMPSSHLILCCPLLLLPPMPPSIRVFSSESAHRMRWPKYWSFSFSISPSKEIPGLISFRMDWLDLLAVQGTLKSLLQHHSSKALILWRSDFFTVQLSHPYMTTGKTIALTKWTFVGKAFLSNLLTRQIGHSLIWFFVFCTVLTTVH